MSAIRVLPEALAARIAAGEVVERPASVVKELVENALDAGARRVDVHLEGGGRNLIRVVDDGVGMDRDDALLAFEQHATSKLPEGVELEDVQTHGFRGEALAAIGACSATCLVTAQADGEGTRVRFEHGRLADVTSCGAPRGTSVEVRGLFARLPARRKFLRTAATELSHAVRFLEQQALTLPDRHFTLVQQGRVLLDLPPAGDVAGRVEQVLGTEFVERALHVEGESHGVAVQAWLSPPSAERTGTLGILVNGRVVSDRLLAHAARDAARRAWGRDGSPSGLLLVDLPVRDVDVNVHPSKREVRFARPWEVHDTVRDLLRGDAVDSGFFGPRVEVDPGAGIQLTPSAGTPAAGTPAAQAPSPGGDVPPAGPEPWLHDTSVSPRRAGESGPGYRALPTAVPLLDSPRRVLGQVHGAFIIVEDADGLLVVDQHAAHARVLAERLLRDRDGDGDGATRQALLEPVVIDLPSSLAVTLDERSAELRRLGFEVEAFGDRSAMVRTVPAALGEVDPTELVVDLLEADAGGNAQQRLDRLAGALASRAAVARGTPLGHERLRWLVDALFATESPATCPAGRPTWYRLGASELERRFGRAQAR